MATIKKDKNGNYYFVASLGFDPVSGKRIQKWKSGFKTKKEAQQAHAEIMNNYGKNAYSSSSTMLFEEFFFSIFLPYYRAKVKERTYQNRLSTMDNKFSYFYKMKLENIKPVYIQKWQNKLAERYENSYVRNIYGFFQMCLDRAVILGMIPSNPAKIVGNVRKAKKEVEFWTKEDFEKVIATFHVNDYYEHFAFICLWLYFMTGMRFGEGQALQWVDIDVENKTLQINKTLYYKKATQFEFVAPKTKASNRLIALDEDTMNYLKLWKEKQDSHGGSNFVLSYNGLPTNKHTVRHILKRHAKFAGVHDIRIHALRHSHASLLISMGENALLIKERLGHEDVQTTLGTYGHLYPNTSFQIAERLHGSINVNLSKVKMTSNTKNQFTTKRKYNCED